MTRRCYISTFLSTLLLPTLLSTAFFLGIPPTDVYSRPVSTLRSGHDARITTIASYPRENLLFTTGEDGKLMVWEPGSDRLLQSIRIDRLPITKMQLFPDQERIAVYTSDGRRDHRISVWNWTTSERLYLHRADDEVLWMDVSANSSYLVYSIPGLRSVRMLDASSGRSLPFLQQTTGIVNWFVIAGSEDRVMTYAPSSGVIAYRNVVTGSIDGRFEAPAGLSHLTLLEQRRYAAARMENGRLGILDLLSGTIVAETAAGEIESIQRDPLGPDILVVSRTAAAGRSVNRYRFERGRLQQRFEPRRSLPDSVQVVSLNGRQLYGGDSSGRLYRWPAFQSEQIVFAESIVNRITDLHFVGDRLFLLTADRLYSISSDFFRDVVRSDRSVSFVDQWTTPLVAGPESRFLETGTGEILLWTPNAPDGDARLREFDAASGRSTPLDISIPGNILSLHAHRSEILTFSRAGHLALIDRETGRSLFTYRGSGFQTAIRSDRDIFLGKAFGGGVLDSAILRLDPRTSQTVPMDTESHLVFSLTYDERRGRLFAIGLVRGRSGTTNTVVEVFDGPNYGRRRTILEIPGEYLDARVVVDPLRGTVYTTLDDRGGILSWDGLRVSELTRNHSHIPRRLLLSGDYVFSLNWDGTVSVIDRHDGETAIDIAVLQVEDDTRDGWLALRPDGFFYVSRPDLAAPNVISINRDDLSMEDLVFDAPDAEVIPPPFSPAGRDRSPDPMNRFESGRSRDERVEEETDRFDPESDEPAPSS